MGIYIATIARIDELLNEQNLTVNALAYKSGVPQATIKSILNGESINPGIVTIKKISDGFGKTICEFFDSPAFEGLDQEVK